MVGNADASNPWRDRIARAMWDYYVAFNLNLLVMLLDKIGKEETQMHFHFYCK